MASAGLSARAALDPRRDRHRRFALGAAVLAISVCLLAGRPGLGAQLVLLAAAVAVLGLPHGALDLPLAREAFRGRLGPAWLPLFGASYLGAAGAVLAGWAVAPVATLVAFLAVSALHFGWGDAEEAGRWRAADAVARGLLPVLLPGLFHPGETGLLFAWLTGTAPEATEVWTATAARALAAPWAALACAVTVRAAARGEGSAAAEIPVLALAFAVLPPLLAFGVYFCLFHAPRHLIEVSAGGTPVRDLLRAAVPSTLLALALAAAGWFWLRPEALPAGPALLRVLFWGLASLTAPHMILAAVLSAPVRGPSGAPRAPGATRAAGVRPGRKC